MFSNNADSVSFVGIEPVSEILFDFASKTDYLTNENFKTLRTNILFCGSDIKTIVLTSSRENEGKTTTSTELSKSLADAGKKTLLIDADMRKSVLLKKEFLRQSYYFGLSEYLSGQADLNEILYKAEGSSFDVIFSGHFPPNPVELLSSSKFKELLEAAKEAYDYVIIDSPPLGSVIDAAVISSNCDGAVMVVTPGKITIKETVDIKNQLTKSGCKILGVILNDIESKRTKYYKKYEASYSKKRRKRYK